MALGLTKRLLDRSLNTSLEEMATLESFAQAVLFATDDHQAARKAFQDKSKPTFEGH